eukprot:CAMPEP_0172307772 /NCGR_PEP_ID=MMETSP1058-20130122/8553_1 /TAXON_ID=83371 /ORGANISM="Detonula confervacea, Strain CCMP 353" /LENGTH=301 /DNA_ID=CAMNT_0013020029 /DNA_START=39 /DNA_END=944 /DNA_ORIENTATION=+
MTAKRLNNPHFDDEQDGNKPGERSGDDDSSGEDESVSDDDSRSSSESNIEESPKESPPPESMNADQIRQNARELLQSSPGHDLDPSKKKRDTASISNDTADKANGYQSYHDAPTVRTSPTSQFSNSNATTTPPWSGSHNENEEGLSMTDVASMTFTCVAHCLTEGYRAASNYYSGYEEDQYLSVSGQNSSHNNYQQAGSYHNEAYNNSTPHNNSTPRNNYDDHKTRSDATYKNGYSGGYQTKFSDHSSQHKEVMDRGDLSHSNNNAYSSQISGHETEQTKEEWATVQVPSTYQGGRVGSGN